MALSESFDENGVEYFFDCIYAADITDPNNVVVLDHDLYDSGWVNDPAYSVKVVQAPNYEYVFQAYARQKTNRNPGEPESTYLTQAASTRGAFAGTNPRTLEVPYPYFSIQSAVLSAQNGDTVVVHPGTYAETNIDFGGKAITVRSVNPANPDIVATTIIDPSLVGLSSSDHGPNRAFIFQTGEGRDSAIDGFTIQNAAAVSCS
jgi:hypothetical protein